MFGSGVRLLPLPQQPVNICPRTDQKYGVDTVAKVHDSDEFNIYQDNLFAIRLTTVFVQVLDYEGCEVFGC